MSNGGSPECSRRDDNGGTQMLCEDSVQCPLNGSFTDDEMLACDYDAVAISSQCTDDSEPVDRAYQLYCRIMGNNSTHAPPCRLSEEERGLASRVRSEAPSFVSLGARASREDRYNTDYALLLHADLMEELGLSEQQLELAELIQTERDALLCFALRQLDLEYRKRVRDDAEVFFARDNNAKRAKCNTSLPPLWCEKCGAPTGDSRCCTGN